MLLHPVLKTENGFVKEAWCIHIIKKQHNESSSKTDGNFSDYKNYWTVIG